MGLQPNAHGEHAEKLERAFGVLEEAITSQNAQAIEQTKLLWALIGQLTSAAATSTTASAPLVEETARSNPSQSSVEPIVTPAPSIQTETLLVVEARTRQEAQTEAIEVRTKAPILLPLRS